MRSWIHERRFSVLDVEATGTDPDSDRVVQIALVSIDAGCVTETWSSYVNPECPIPPESTVIHGVTDTMATLAPTFAQIAPELIRRATGRQLVGYGILRFDSPIMRTELGRAGYTTSGRMPLDVLVWVREVDRWARGRGRHKLDATIQRWNVPRVGRAHDAVSDALATWDLLRMLLIRKPHYFPDEITSVLARQHQLHTAQEQEADRWREESERRRAEQHGE